MKKLPCKLGMQGKLKANRFLLLHKLLLVSCHAQILRVGPVLMEAELDPGPRRSASEPRGFRSNIQTEQRPVALSDLRPSSLAFGLACPQTLRALTQPVHALPGPHNRPIQTPAANHIRSQLLRWERGSRTGEEKGNPGASARYQRTVHLGADAERRRLAPEIGRAADLKCCIVAGCS